MDTPRAFSDRLASLLRDERTALSEFLVALAEFDRQRVWVELGHASLFGFLVRELGLSKGAAQYRKVAAELIQRVPAVIAPLRSGQLCLTTVIELARVVTAENCGTVLPRFFGLSKREAMEVVAALDPHPAPPTRTLVTTTRSPLSSSGSSVAAPSSQPASSLPFDTPSPSGFATPSPSTSTEPWPSTPARSPLTTPAPRNTASARTTVAPLTAEKSRLHVTVSPRFLRKLAAARDALSHALPSASEEEILEAGLDLLIARAEKRRGAVVRKPRVSPRTPASAPASPSPLPSTPTPTPTSTSTSSSSSLPSTPTSSSATPSSPPASTSSDPRYIPAHVRRAVWERDHGRCQFPLASGGVCGSTYRLELDDVDPVALGGEPTVSGLRVACRFHNVRAARLRLGDAVMDAYTSEGRGAGGVLTRGRSPHNSVDVGSP